MYLTISDWKPENQQVDKQFRLRQDAAKHRISTRSASFATCDNKKQPQGQKFNVVQIYDPKNVRNHPNIIILVKSSKRPCVFLPIYGKAIRTISISFAFANRPAYQSSITENG